MAKGPVASIVLKGTSETEYRRNINTVNIKEVMLKTLKDGEKVPILTELVCEISCEFKTNRSISNILVHCTDV